MKSHFELPRPFLQKEPVFGWDNPWLAPMAGYTDLPFRILCSSFGAAVCETEMVSAAGLALKSQATASLLHTVPEETTLIVQLFGNDPSYVAQAVHMLREGGWLYFDFNMGCPAKKVIRQGAGSALLDNLPRALELAKTLINGVKKFNESYLQSEKPALAGFKIRTGFQYGNNVLPDLALRLEDLGADWITLHPRYGTEIFTGNANWEEITKLTKRLSIPLLASGDLLTAEKGIACLKQTGATGIMYARGALKNPAIYEDHKMLLSGAPKIAFTKNRLCEIVSRHIESAKKYYLSERGFNKLRSIMPRYVKHLPGVGEFRQALANCHDWDCLLNEFNRFMTRNG